MVASERPGYLRLHSLPAADFWWARNSLTQRAIGPESIATTELDAAGMKPGDVAGLALLNSPYAWIGVKRDDERLRHRQYDHSTGKSVREPLDSPHVWLRAHCDFDTEIAKFSYSSNGKDFKAIGREFEGVPAQDVSGGPLSPCSTTTRGSPGGHADFDVFPVDEPRPRGSTKPIPVSQSIMLTDLSNGNALAMVDGKRHR